MKTFNESIIHKSELLQLIILHNLYSHPLSRKVYFQGGTEIRWCHGGTRFSEDLDFVTHLTGDETSRMMQKLSGTVERDAQAHFGAGSLTLKQMASRDEASKYMFSFLPETGRDRVAVKVEFERLAPEMTPENERIVLGTLPGVVHLITTGDFKVPLSSAVMLCETPVEIMSDKMRALLERPYLKGRDLFDLWFLHSVKGIGCNKGIFERKLKMYSMPFKEVRQPSFFTSDRKKERAQMAEALTVDLKRFIAPGVFDAISSGDFKEIIDTVKKCFEDIAR